MIPECGQWSLVTQGGHWTAAGDRSIDPSIGRILVMQIYSGMRLSSSPLPSIRGRNYLCCHPDQRHCLWIYRILVNDSIVKHTVDLDGSDNYIGKFNRELF